jgi:hypothetical protein
MTAHTGSCLCGGVKYRISGPLREVIACHCIQCRKTSGHYVAATQCEAKDMELEAETLVWFKSSDTAERGFCGRCGSNLFWRRFGNEHVSIWAGTIDGETGLRMESQLHSDSKGDYYDLPECTIIDQSSLK